MDKEQILALAEKIRIEVIEEFGYQHRYTQEESIIKKGQERLISAYKAELLKEAGEPVAVTNHAQLGYVTDGMHPDIPLAMWAKETSYSGANIALYTSDQVAAAVAKATGPLEEEIERLRTDNIAFARNLKGKSATTGATYEHICTQLAAAQAYAEQLRDLLANAIQFQDSYYRYADAIAEALSIPASTEALDQYVAEKVKEQVSGL